MKKLASILILSLCFFALSAKEFTVSIGAGSNWKEKRDPQVAVWLEDTNGKNVKNLYVTQRASKKNWIMGPKEGRPESLPVWYNHQNSESFDAVTSATPKGGLIFSAEYNFIPGNDYFICVELNNSFDYNENWPKKAKKNDRNFSGVNGQPSVIYKAQISAESKGEVELKLAGTGSVDGSDGKIHNEINKLTTAKNIARHVAVSFE